MGNIATSMLGRDATGVLQPWLVGTLFYIESYSDPIIHQSVLQKIQKKIKSLTVLDTGRKKKKKVATK